MKLSDDELMQSITQVIVRFFDAGIVNNENYGQSDKLKLAVAQFTDWKYDWRDRKIFKDLKEKLPTLKIENMAYFFGNTRSLQLDLSESSGNRQKIYSAYVSVFNFFTIYQSDYLDGNGKTELIRTPSFIDYGGDLYCDEVFRITKGYYKELVWLPAKMLLTPVQQLRIGNFSVRKDILVADLLFSHLDFRDINPFNIDDL